MYDIIIKNGTIIDGKKTPRFQGDIGISKDSISAIGDLSNQSSYTTIDAGGKYVTPGFIDITNHSDTHWSLFNDPGQESMLRQGITTIMGGACGSSLAPLVKIDDINAIQKWTDLSTVNVNWLSMAEYIAELKRHPLGINFGTLVGHGTLRQAVVGDKNRAAGKEELAQMRYLLAQALEEGAFGMSLGLAFSKGKSATNDEILYLAKQVADSNKIVTVHLRDEGKNILPSVTEAIHIMRETGAMVHISHYKALGREAWDDLPKTLNLIQQAINERLSLTLDVFPYSKTGSLLYALLPIWAREETTESIMKKISNPVQRQTIIESLEHLSLHYSRITIASAKNNRSLAGKTIQEISANMGLSPEETFLEILKTNDLGVTIFGDTIHDDLVATLYKQPFTLFATDGFGLDLVSPHNGQLAHPRSVGATARFLGDFVRDKEIVSWEDGIYQMTHGPAARFGIQGRGVLEKGSMADVVVLDPEALADKATYENPFQYPEGISWVILNGKIVVEQAATTETFAGNILTK